LIGVQESKKGEMTADRQRIESLKAERRTLVPTARLQGDAGAQKRIVAIDSDLPALERGVADQETAFAVIVGQLAGVDGEIARAEWEEQRAELRELLENRLTGKVAADLEKKAAAFASALKAAAEEDERIAAALISFEPGLRGARDNLQTLKRIRAQILGFGLRKVLPIDTWGLTESRMDGRSAAASELRAYEAALESLNRLELVF
jgi:hypothetical protein